jgi:hypothetical protein
MPFRVLGLDLIDATGVCYLLAPSRQSVPFQKGAEMLSLKNPILTAPPPSDGVELTRRFGLEGGSDGWLATLAVRLDRQTLRELGELAHASRLRPAQLVQAWVRERVRQEHLGIPA